MAKTTTAVKDRPQTVKKAGEARRPAARPAASGRKAAPGADDEELNELAALAAAAKELEDEERSKTESSNLFISLVQGTSSVLMEGDPRYIPEAQLNDYVIAQKRLVLGQALDATVLGVFKLYEQKKKKEKDNEMAPTIGFWMPEQAEMVPLPKGENFARYLANGDVLIPAHWVFLYLHTNPDLEGVVLGFRSIGNRVCGQLQKLLKRESTLCTELRLKIGRQGIRNETYARTIQYPDFDIVGKNFDYIDGNVVPVKGGLGVKELKVVLARSKEIHEEYAQHRMVAMRSQESLKALIGSPVVQAALPSAHSALDDGDHKVTQF